MNSTFSFRIQHIIALMLFVTFCSAPGRCADAPLVINEASGPIGLKSPPCKWGVSVKDELNSESVWFGGAGGLSPTGALLTWTFKNGTWARADYKPKSELSELHQLVNETRGLCASVSNRYYVAEKDAAKALKLDDICKNLAEKISKIVVSESKAKKYADEALQELNALSAKLAGRISAKEIASARAAWTALVKLEFALSPEPQARNCPAMAYDTETKKIVLFGGEGEFGAYNDTWIYDCATRTWSKSWPSLAPSPRCGAGLTAVKGKAYLAGGFEPNGSMSYCAGLWKRLPVDIWEFDIAAAKWTRLKAGEEKVAEVLMQPVLELSYSSDAKTLSWKSDTISYQKKTGELKGTFNLTAGDANTDTAGVPDNTFKVRELGFDPAWYENVPPSDPDAFQATLKALPLNKWINVKPPVQHVNRDWGTVAIDLDRDQLLHWAGGHSSHNGTDVAHYSLSTNRWHILYTPELPFEYTYSNDGATVPTLSGRPWSPHSYLSYAWDSVSGQMLWAGKHPSYSITNPVGAWAYDPATYEWSATPWKIESGWFDIERHKTCMVRTPLGLVVWGDKRGGSGGETGLWLAKVAEHTFTPIAATDKKDSTSLPFTAFGDAHGMTYDTQRDRVLLFHFGIKDKQKVWACDLKTKAITVIEPKNSAAFPQDVRMGREATYIPELDIVLIATCGKVQRTLVYDCADDQWLEMADPCTGGAKPDPAYGNSTGVKWDPKRKLLWLVQTTGAVYAMRLERQSMGLKPVQ